MKFLSRIRDMFSNANVRKPIQPAGTPALKPKPVAPTLPPTIKAANEVINAGVHNERITVHNGANPLPPVTHRRTSKAGIDLMHQFEGCERKRPDGRFEAYLCPAKVWTIGWGSTGKDPFNGGMIRRGTIWTREQCDRRFEMHLAQFEEGVRDGIGKAPTTQAQFDAMCSLSYNIGVSAFRKSTLLRLHNAGDYEGAANQFLRWNRARGKVLNGLTRRRKAEADLYRSGS